MDRQLDKKEIMRRSLKRRLPLLIIGILLAGGAVAAITALSKSIKESDLRLCEVREGALTVSVPASGLVKPLNEQIINSPVESYILKVYAQPGDSVKAGQPLLELDLEETKTQYQKLLNEMGMKQQSLRQTELNNSTSISELEMKIKVKEMDLRRLKVEEQNERRLDSIGSGTGDRVRQAHTAYETSRLELEQMRQTLAIERLRNAASVKAERLGIESFEKDLALTRRILNEGRVPAPYSGVLIFLNTSLGSRVSPGEKLAVVADLGSFRIEGELPEGSASKVAVGSDVIIRAGGASIKGRISNINPQAQSGIIKFIVSPDNPTDRSLRSGRRVELDIESGYKDKVILISNGSYYTGPGDYFMFVRKGDKLERRKVRLGESNRTSVEVVSGLQPGETVTIGDMKDYSNYKTIKIK